MPEPLMIKCLYRADGIQCVLGLLCDSVAFVPLWLEGKTVRCPACEGKGVLLTPAGRELRRFLTAFPVNAE